jgi:hypothetical protein
VFLSSLISRVEQLPILLEELRFHLLNYDEVRNPPIDCVRSDAYTKNFNELDEELKIIKAIEKFITHVMISRDCLFSNNLVEDDKRTLVPRTIEKLFFEFNHIYSAWNLYGNTENPISRKIKCSLDLELFLSYFLNLDRYFHISPHESLLEYNRLRRAKYALHSSRAFNKSKTKSTLSSNEPELYDRQRLFNASRLLLENIVDVSHKEQVNQVTSKNSARFRNANEYISNLFDQNGSLTFIALDLCFSLKHFDLKSKKKHLKNFKNRIRNHSLFSHMLGYLGKWEYSILKGVYVHMIFVFTKIEKHMLDTIPEMIGGFWKNFSDDKFASFHYAYISGGTSKLNATLCTISSKNEQLRQELQRRTIYYLTHSQSYYLYKEFIPPIPKEVTIKQNKLNKEEDKSKKPRKPRSFEIFFKGELPKELVEAKKALNKERKLKKEIKDREKAEFEEMENYIISSLKRH